MIFYNNHKYNYSCTIISDWEINNQVIFVKHVEPMLFRRYQQADKSKLKF